MSQLYRNHRTWGLEYARATAPDGTELVILQVAPHKLEAVPAHLLLTVSEGSRANYIEMALIDAIGKARFYGLMDDEIRTAFEKVMAMDAEACL